MTHLQKLRTLSSLKWVSLDFNSSNVKSSKMTLCPNESNHQIVQNIRFYGRNKSSIQLESCSNIDGRDGPTTVSQVAWKEAQAALLDYLHITRSMPFMDAEHMSHNSPIFLGNLLQRVNAETEIGRSITRFLRYHPINEFEPFFESIGLKPFEYSPLLPRNLMFLEDDALLLENYHVLSSYGIQRNSIGKIYKLAEEVFRYDHGVLQAKLQAFEKAGLEKSTIIKIVSSSPDLLIEGGSRPLREVIGKFRSFVIGSEWIRGHLVEGYTYNWNHILELLRFLSKMVCNEEQLDKIVRHCPAFLFESSGNTAFSIVGFLLKFGTTKCDMSSMFLNLPEVQASQFLTNLRQCYKFLVDIEMEVEEIGKIVRSHPVLLGSCSLKSLLTIQNTLNTGNGRIRDMVKENPEILKEWVYGLRIRRLPKLEEDLSLKMMKTKFLLDLGFTNNSNEMQKALKTLRGNAWELQERFDAFVTAGLSRNDLIKMIEKAPRILNQSKDLIEMKLNFLVNELGYPLSSLVEFPTYVCYTMQRVKLRVSMYVWLRDSGSVGPKPLGSIVVRPEEEFTRWYVSKHPKGPQVWQELKKQICTDSRVHLPNDSNPSHKSSQGP